MNDPQTELSEEIKFTTFKEIDLKDSLFLTVSDVEKAIYNIADKDNNNFEITLKTKGKENKVLINIFVTCNIVGYYQYEIDEYINEVEEIFNNHLENIY